MTFLVEVGFTAGAGVDPAYFRLDDPVSGLLDQGLLAPSGLTTDLSSAADGFSRVMAFEIDRGSTQGAGALVEYAAGTLSLTLRDDDGDLDPANIDEPIPGISIRLSKVWSGVVYPLFTGTIDSWEPELRAPSQAVVVVTASDALAGVGGYDRGPAESAGADEPSGDRVNRILDTIGWPAGQRLIDTGVVTLVATTSDGNALDELRQVARAEVGELWATPAGLIRFRDRYGLYTRTEGNVVQATFGANRAAGELPYVGQLGLSYDRSSMVNVVRAARAEEGATVYEVGHSDSRARYRDKAIEQTDLTLSTDDQVANWADYVLARDADPKLRIADVTIDVRANEPALYPQVLQRDFGDRIAVVRRPPGVAADTREAYIRGVRHLFQAPTQWQTTWELEPAASGDPFILDDPVRGRLDLNSLIY